MLFYTKIFHEMVPGTKFLDKNLSNGVRHLFPAFRFQNNHGRTRTDTDELTNNSEISPVCLCVRFTEKGLGILPKKGCAETANPAPPSVLSVRVCG
jgi:hypothetical protein